MKRILCPIVALLCATSLRAQSEPEKSPAAAKQASRPPTIHEPAHPPAEQSPPPAVAPTKSATETGAQPHIEKNPPPLDPKNMDTTENPKDDFYSYANGSRLKNHP